MYFKWKEEGKEGPFLSLEWKEKAIDYPLVQVEAPPPTLFGSTTNVFVKEEEEEIQQQEHQGRGQGQVRPSDTRGTKTPTWLRLSKK